MIAPVSNGNIALIVDMAKHAGLPWDVVLGAELARAYKPQPEAYLRSAEALGIAPREAMMVAAHNGDLEAAARPRADDRVRAATHRARPRPDHRSRARGDWDVVAADFVALAATATSAADSC